MKLALLSVSTVVFALTAGATSITFNFTSGGTNVGSGLGNVRTFTSTDGQLSVTATAWGVTTDNNTKFAIGQLGQAAGVGLGVCDADEGANCAYPQSSVDNGSAYDFVLFQFASPVTVTSVQIQPTGFFDRDVTYYTGTTTAALTGMTLSQLSGLGLTSTHNDDSDASLQARTVTLTSIQGSSLLFGSRVNGDGFSDYFDIGSLTVNYTAQSGDGHQSATPEPATLGMIGGGLLGLGLFSRRYNKSR